MKNKFKFLATMLIGILLSTNVWGGTTVTYKQSSTSAASVDSGTAPTGSSVTFNNTYTTKEQLTNGNSMTLTLSGYKGCKITAISLSMKSNKSSGSGTFSAVAGTTTLASISSNTAFSSWYNITSYTTSYTTVNVTMTNANYEIKDGEDVVITITCPTGKDNNSLYCQSFTLTYETAAPSNPYTVTFYTASGVSQAITEASAGAGVTPPSMEQTCGDYTFAGWSKTQRLTEVTTATTIETLTTGKYYPTANTTLYPIYSKTGGGTSDFSLSVTSGSFRISSGGNYATGNIGSTSNGKYSSTTDVSNARMFTFTKVSDGVYTIYDESKGEYVKYSSSTDLAYNSGTAYNWTITADESLWNLASSTQGRYFSYKNTGVFGGYASTTGDYSNVSITGTSSTYYFSYPSCASCTNTITITKGAESNGTFILSRSGNNVCIDDDATIIVSNITPAEHYHIAEVTTTNGTVTGPEDGKYTVIVTGDAMIGVTFEQDAKVTVTWVANGTTVSTVDVFPGETANAPAAPEDIPDCADAFVGWSTSTLTGTGHSAPSDLFNTTSPEITENVTFNAVFATAAGGGTVTHTMDVPQDVAISGYEDRNYADDQGSTWSGTFSGFENGGERFWSLSKNPGNYHISSPTFAGNVSSIKFWVRQTASGTRSIILRSNTSTAQPSVSDMGLTADVSQNDNVQEVTITPTTQEFTQFNIYVSNGFGFRKIQVVTGGGATYSNYVTTCATYTVTWMSNGFEIRKDENVAPGTVLTAPTVDDVRDVNTKAACGDHLVGWMPAASTTNPKVKQDTAPEGMVGQQVTVRDNVVYHAVYADVDGE